MEGSISSRKNALLGRLSAGAYRRVRACLEYREYAVGDRLVQEAKKTRFVHFPVFGAVARLVLDMNGHSSSFGVCGREGMIGLSALSGGEPVDALGTVVVVLRCGVFRCPAETIEAELAMEDFRAVLIRYFRYVLSESVLTGFCNKHHSVDQQLCRLLLTLADRTGSTEVRTTHQLMAEVLGSRREGITEATARLRKADIVDCARGVFRIRNRDALLEHSCDCYARMQDRYLKLITPVPLDVMAGD